MCGGYPMGAQYDPKAPWNKEPEVTKVSICISATYHKYVELEIKGDYDEVTLNYLARQAVYDTHKHMDDNNWTEDEFEVIEEDEIF